MSIPVPTDPVPSAPSLGAARLRLAQRPSLQPGGVDGAWWPRSRILVEELPGLVIALRELQALRIARVSYNPELWVPTPNRVVADGHVIRLGWFASIDPQIMTLSAADSDRRVALFVIPPHTTDARADKIMARIAQTGATPPSAFTRV